MDNCNSCENKFKCKNDKNLQAEFMYKKISLLPQEKREKFLKEFFVEHLELKEKVKRLIK